MKSCGLQMYSRSALLPVLLRRRRGSFGETRRACHRLYGAMGWRKLPEAVWPTSRGALGCRFLRGSSGPHQKALSHFILTDSWLDLASSPEL
jgi:hypothetical protein